MSVDIETSHAVAPATAPTGSTSRALIIALASAAAFGTSGPFAKELFSAGWSPAAAVTMRIGIAAAILAIPAARELRGRWYLLRTHLRAVLLYGLFGVAGGQLFYFLAVQHLSVGVALLLEYLSPTLLVLLAWARTRRAPSRLTLLGAVVALAGLMLVLDVFGSVSVDAIGVVFGLGAAVCSATYFVVAAETPEDGLSPLVLSGAGLAVGLVPLLLLGVTGALPMHASTRSVPLAGWHVSVLVPVLGISVLAAAFAYVSGVVAARMLGTRVASFVALAEVLFAVLFAWFFLGELPLPVQLVGGGLIVLGVVLVRAADRGDTLAD
ncbi:DMT family transporter [Allobranchiibius sp. CTAmp26]|uniref:EamA family transporter n=1 Tax=Allobranchiibius sp. CTAmp26 TaxID=2815214 RepID=UPI001AA1D339|nr:DMT family transporter [Allobranchiibius sp. CTAmp26]MBO1753696.1 EamA family transporter [Allobranchiibius sp. CTAmp26]